MSQKKIQKVFYYSSNKNKQVIENIINNIATNEQTSSSRIIENILYSSLIPSNKLGKTSIELLFSDGENNVQKTITALFEINSAGLSWKAQFYNFLPLLQYITELEIDINEKNVEKQLPYLKKQLESINDKVNDAFKNCDAQKDKFRYKCVSDNIIYLKEHMHDLIMSGIVKEYYKIIIDVWDIMFDWTITYRYLCVLSSITVFPEDIDNVNKLYHLIMNLSSEWNDI